MEAQGLLQCSQKQPLHPIPSQMNSIQVLVTHLFKIHISITLPPTDELTELFQIHLQETIQLTL
jgi:hypothetical protein